MVNLKHVHSDKIETMNREVLKLYDLFNISKILYLYDHRKVSLMDYSLGPQSLDVRVDVCTEPLRACLAFEL